MFSSNTSQAGSGPVYVEDVFSTYLYTGNGSTQSINNGINLSGNGGLVWMKGRSSATDHAWYDTVRGATKDLVSNSTAAQTTESTGLTSFDSTGFSISSLAKINTSTSTYASWTFREQPKFFDVVSWTGTGPDRTIAHSLGSTPGCIIIKRTDAADSWYVVHRSAPGGFNGYGVLNSTNAWVSSSSGVGLVNSTSFTVSSYYNGSGSTWVAYLFAHDAGGFGLTGTDSVISCGSLTATGTTTGPTATLGWEPQWVLCRNASVGTGGWGQWLVFDNMRGMPSGSANTPWLAPNAATKETTNAHYIDVSSTGFTLNTDSGLNYPAGDTIIYIAIRKNQKS